MVGQVLGAVGELPEIFTELEISYFLLRRLLGVRTEGDKKAAKVSAAVTRRPREVTSISCHCLKKSPSSMLIVSMSMASWVISMTLKRTFRKNALAGPEAVEERSAYGEHRVTVDRRPR